MTIGKGGVTVFPRFAAAPEVERRPRPTDAPRLMTGVPGLDALLGGGVFEGSTTFVAGSAGAGKSTLGMQFILAGAKVGQSGIFVALEETPAQLREMAESLELPIDDAIDRDLVRIIHLARERVRPNQVLAMLTEKVAELGTRRLVLDGASHLLRESSPAAEQRDFIDALVSRLSHMGVTVLLTFETRTLQPSGMVTDRGVSPIADNLVMLRYRESESGLRPTVTVIKTRGSAHDFRTHDVVFGLHGLRVVSEAKSMRRKPITKKKRKRS